MLVQLSQKIQHPMEAMMGDISEIREKSAEAIRHALDGTAMIFVGSGVGYLSKNKLGDNLPSGRTLSDLLHTAVGIPVGKYNLGRISQHAQKKLGRENLIGILSERLTATEINERLSELYNLPWLRIYTTNYDNVIESSRKQYSTVSSFNLADDPIRAPIGAIVHLNGKIDNVRPDQFDKDIILTDLSYSINEFRDSHWAKQFLVDIRTSRSIIFVGYSMYDLDIARILLEDPDIADKTIIYVSPEADELEIDSLSNYGLVSNGGFEELYDTLAEAKHSYVPIKNVSFSELRQVQICQTESNLSPAEKVYRQLVYGDIAEKEYLISEQPRDGISYLSNRSQLSEALQVIDRGHARDLFIHGEIASGKSACCVIAAKYFLNRDYEVYFANQGPHLTRDLERLASRDVPVCVIFDGYGAFIDDVKNYSARRRPSHRMVLTERTASHDLIAAVIERATNFGPAIECHLSHIAEPDLTNLSELINFAGLWGERSGMSLAGKVSALRNNLQGSLYLALVEIINSKNVRNEIQRLLTPLNYDRKALLVFISAFVVNTLGFRFEINDWQTFFRIESIRRLVRNYNEQFHNFMNISGGELLPRSGLLSTYILKNFASDSDIVDCLHRLYKSAADAQKYDSNMKDLRIQLMRYGAIEGMLSDENKHSSILNYYNQIRSVGDTVENADYWLQLGIASTSHNDLEGAQIAFDNAYSREKKKKNPLLKRIDNYYARFEMKKAIAETDSGKAFAIFSEANTRLSKQIFDDNNRHYPFKTSREFVGVAARHFDKWTDDQQTLFLDMMRDVRRRAIRYRDEKGDVSPDVSFLIKETAALLSKLGIE